MYSSCGNVKLTALDEITAGGTGIKAAFSNLEVCKKFETLGCGEKAASLMSHQSQLSASDSSVTLTFTFRYRQ